jgi:glucose/arabinose dehydrogenase
MRLIILVLIVLVLIVLVLISIVLISYALSNVYAEKILMYAFARFQDVQDSVLGPSVLNNDLVLETFTEGLNQPISLIAINNEILVLERYTGKVQKISPEGDIQQKPVLENITSNNMSSYKQEFRGMTNFENDVYIFHTGQDNEGDPLHNIITKYNYDGSTLVNPIEIQKSLGGHRENLISNHVSGVMASSLNNEIFALIGDAGVLNKYSNFDVKTHGESFTLKKTPYTSEEREVSASIIKITDGGVEHFAMGLRNGFGLDVDPVTGFLWQTDNGDDYYDEINLVNEKFNGGWAVLSGPTTRDRGYSNLDTNDLYIHYPNYEYVEPKFSWHQAVGVTAIEFPELTNNKYSNYVFVADLNNGAIYKFQLNENRDGFVFYHDDLKDSVLDLTDNSEEIRFISGIPGGITDLLFHNDALYVNTIYDGVIFKIPLND